MNLNQVTVTSKDLYESVRFYQKLGLKLIVDSLPHYVRFECPDGDATFSVIYSEILPDDSVHVYFECHNLDEKVETLITKGVQFQHLPKDQEWLWREAYLEDPDGNHIVLYKAGENRKNPPWRID